MVNNKKKIDTFNYKGWLLSDNFLKRAFAVWGHYFVAHLIVLGFALIFIVLLILVLGVANIIIR